jgi:NADPH:quinone reductase-like Zn-dependent oxidoreductase
MRMNAFIEAHALRPVIDRVFDYAAAPAAFAHMEAGDHFGKVVIRHG